MKRAICLVGIFLLPCVPLRLHSQSIRCDTIAFESNDARLQGYFFPSYQEGKNPTVLFLQGLPGEIGDELELGKNLSTAGINLFSFNYSGIFKSEGMHSLAEALRDIESALAFLRSRATVQQYRIDTAAIIVGGYSFGGGMALTYLQHHPSHTRVFSIAGTDHGQFAHEVSIDSIYMKTMVGYFDKYLKPPNGPVRFAFSNPIEELLGDPARYDNRAMAPRLTNNDVLIIGALDDRNVTLEHHLLPLYRALKSNKGQKVALKVYQTTHSFKNVIEELNRDIIAWIRR